MKNIKDYIFSELQKRESSVDMHERLRENLIGCLRDEYVGRKSLGDRYAKEGIIINKFNPTVNLFTSIMITHYERMIIDEIVSIIEKDFDFEGL